MHAGEVTLFYTYPLNHVQAQARQSVCAEVCMECSSYSSMLIVYARRGNQNRRCLSRMAQDTAVKLAHGAVSSDPQDELPVKGWTMLLGEHPALHTVPH
jgi:hypothetical protein